MSEVRDVVVIGAGGHAKVVIDLIRENGNCRIVGLIDADPTPRHVLGVPVVGDDASLTRLRRTGVRHAFPALGDNRRRLALADRLRAEGFELINAISRSAMISSSVRLGRGIAIMPGAVVNADSTIGDLAIINTRASVDHDGCVGEAAHVGPGSALAGCVRVGRLAFLGAGASVIPGISIGDGAIIGAGACVVRDVAPGVVAVGVPARVIRQAPR